MKSDGSKMDMGPSPYQDLIYLGHGLVPFPIEGDCLMAPYGSSPLILHNSTTFKIKALLMNPRRSMSKKKTKQFHASFPQPQYKVHNPIMQLRQHYQPHLILLQHPSRIIA